MTEIELIKLYRRRAVALDLVCLLVGGVVLFFGANYTVPVWWMATGCVVALLALVLAIYYARLARKAYLNAASEKPENQQADD